VSGSCGDRVSFEAASTFKDGTERKQSNTLVHLADQKDFSFYLYSDNDFSVGPSGWSSVFKKVHLRTLYKNLVVSAGVDDWNLFDSSNRLPRGFSINTTYIHDHNSDVRVFAGADVSTRLPFHVNSFQALLGLNFKKKHRLIVSGGAQLEETTIAGDKSKNEEEKKGNPVFVPEVRVIGTSKVNDKLYFQGELKVRKYKDEVEKKENKDKCSCCENYSHSLTIAKEYVFDEKNRMKTKVQSDGNLFFSFLHSYGLIDFGFVANV
jgi:hypothetical protein